VRRAHILQSPSKDSRQVSGPAHTCCRPPQLISIMIGNFTPVLIDQHREPCEMSSFIHRADRHGLRYNFVTND
jgi:hypothetical protein